MSGGRVSAGVPVFPQPSNAYDRANEAAFRSIVERHLQVTNEGSATTDWSTIYGTPTTLAGYGITDAPTIAGLAAGIYPIDALSLAWDALNSALYSDSSGNTGYLTLGAANTVFKSTGPSGVPVFAQIVNADVAAAAGIAQSKISGLTTDLAAKQPLDATLTALAGYVTTAGGMLYGTGVDTFANLANPGAASVLTHNATIPVWVTALAKAQQHASTAYIDATNTFSAVQQMYFGSRTVSPGVTPALDVTYVATDASISGAIIAEVEGTNNSQSSYQSYGIIAINRYRGSQSESGSNKGVRAMDASMFVYNTATTAHASGWRCDVRNLSTGTVTNLRGVWVPAMLNSGGGAVTNAIGVDIEAPGIGSTLSLSLRCQGAARFQAAFAHTGSTAGFYNVTPTTRPSAITQTYATADRTHAARTAAALTDNTTGSAGTTLAAGAGIETLVFYIDAATIANGDLLTDYTLGYKFKILSFNARCAKPVTTAGKSATLNLEIGTTNLTGGVISLSGTYVLGAAQAGTAVTAANTGTASDVISIEAASVTAFTEGAFWLIIRVQNMDTADAAASLADQHNKLNTDHLDTAQLVNVVVDDLQLLGLEQ